MMLVDLGRFLSPPVPAEAPNAAYLADESGEGLLAEDGRYLIEE